MSYFHADEQYLAKAAALPPEPPWYVQVEDLGATGGYRVTWRAPYGPVDSYGIFAAGPDGAWREIARLPGTAMVVHLPPGGWRLGIAARRGTTDSSLALAAAPVVPGPAPLITVPAPVLPPAPPTPVLRPAPPPAPEPQFDWQALDQALHANSAYLGQHGLFVQPDHRD
ncbi:MAG TPA: hypothetical protein VM536_04110 [Chloroflexia bacterium]|nr:hypothetical protein [Chloroflexia bacterium]